MNQFNKKNLKINFTNEFVKSDKISGSQFVNNLGKKDEIRGTQSVNNVLKNDEVNGIQSVNNLLKNDEVFLQKFHELLVDDECADSSDSSSDDSLDEFLDDSSEESSVGISWFTSSSGMYFEVKAKKYVSIYSA